MATSSSSTTPLRSIIQAKSNTPKALLSLPGSFHGGSRYAKVRSNSVTLCSRSYAYNFASLRMGSAEVSGKLTGEKQLLQKRRGVVKCATMEEIEAHKTSIEKNAKTRMEKTIDAVRANFSSLSTGRASPSMLDKIEVEYHASPVKLKSIAQISTPDASSILVQPYDKSSLKLMEKAIVKSHLGLSPENDGEVIRITVPPLTSEGRKELSKIVAKIAEEGKVALRNIRRDARKAYEKLEKEKKLSEDNVRDLSSDMQKLIDGYIKKIETIYKQKEKELQQV